MCRRAVGTQQGQSGGTPAMLTSSAQWLLLCLHLQPFRWVTLRLGDWYPYAQLLGMEEGLKTQQTVYAFV